VAGEALQARGGAGGNQVLIGGGGPADYAVVVRGASAAEAGGSGQAGPARASAGQPAHNKAATGDLEQGAGARVLRRRRPAQMKTGLIQGESRRPGWSQGWGMRAGSPCFASGTPMLKPDRLNHAIGLSSRSRSKRVASRIRVPARSLSSAVRAGPSPLARARPGSQRISEIATHDSRCNGSVSPDPVPLCPAVRSRHGP
jgi:hypothetical protein